MSFHYQLLKKRGQARRGRIHTPHGIIETPEFLPVGTQASVKALTPQQLLDLGVQGVLANTYHLYLRPGSQLVEKLGGLHRMMNWPRPIMTDSGGFQAFSLGAGREHGVGKIGGVFPGTAAKKPRGAIMSNMVKINEEGVRFRSHLDGSTHLLTPESSIRIQEELGADMILAFDECTSPLADKAYTEIALERTHRWAVRCLEARRHTPQALYGILQGGAYQDLRERTLDFMLKWPWQGFAVGGSLGKTKEEMHQVLDWTLPGLPDDKPRHLLGIGEFSDLFEGVARGIDTFDCVIPTRFARNGHVFVPPGSPGRSPRGTWNILNARFFDLDEPIQKGCSCYCCRNFSLAYLRHLHKAEEILAYTLCSMHNLHFLLQLMREMRSALEEDRFADLRALYCHDLGAGLGTSAPQ
ncbi:MAG: tRNA guanosine(34) transglycosylase Tgt [Candidatus Eremiobacteraeota bacterium]|nr:tRNA guanosine(34) transglycosylase Tgt [Candidatus Eremiobacteraeota bacterium]MCW5871249.1 tRNA guanosine(34) transglycosylase Tgt [Candidatus Eremiobacteraeota bacterium]